MAYIPTSSTTATKLKRQLFLQLLPAIIKLTIWRFKQSWRFLFFTWLGILTMVILICSGPLFSRISTSAYLRSFLTTAADGPYITLEQLSLHPTANQFQQIEQQNQSLIVQGVLAKYLHQAPEKIIHTPTVDLLTGSQTKSAAFTFNGYDIAQMTQHVKVIQGRLPQTTSDGTVEIVLSQVAANALGLQVGDQVQSRFALADGAAVWNIRVSGIIAPKQDNDPFWAMADPFSNSSVFLASHYYRVTDNQPFFNIVASYDVLKSKIEPIQVASTKGADNAFIFFWRYPFDLAHLDAYDIPALSQQVADLDNRYIDTVGRNVPDLAYGNVFGTVWANLRTSAYKAFEIELIVSLMLLIIMGIVLFLISMLADMLVTRQATVIAIMRSRGATRRHIFGTFVTQWLIIALLALIAGPVLALVLVLNIARFLLSADNQQSLSIISTHPLQALLDIKWYALVSVVIALLVMILATNRASKLDILTLRRESSRNQRVSLWRRLNLDLLYALAVVIGYGAYAYYWPTISTTVGNIDANIYTLLTNLGFLAAPFFVLALLVLFRRSFSLIIRYLARLTARRKSAPAVLALAQMERSPRIASRMVILLTLALATSTFLLCIMATKQEHTVTTANYYVSGADFSASLPLTDNNKSFEQLQSFYSHLQGVKSATLGYISEVPIGDDQSAQGQGSIKLVAVDADTYASTVDWSPTYSEQSLTSLMQELKSHRQDATDKNVVYAVVDTSYWQRYHLSQGQRFSLPLDGSGVNRITAIALAEVHLIPGVYDTASLSWTGAGVLMDYQSFATVRDKVLASNHNNASSSANQANPDNSVDNMANSATNASDTGPTRPGTILLRTDSDPATINRIHHALPGGRDRRSLTTTIEQDAYHINVMGVLGIGIGAALLLALFGTLLSSWLSATSRLTNFAVMRALGMDPRQIAAVLLWEQGLIYGLGIGFGVIVSLLLLNFVAPSVAFFTMGAGHDWDNSFGVPPVHMTIPYLQLAILLAVIVLICILALTLMARTVSKPSISQTLRLNED